jgi:hypothetical protein
MLSEIDQVCEEQVLRLGRELFDFDRLVVTALGPVSRQALQSTFS